MKFEGTVGLPLHMCGQREDLCNAQGRREGASKQQAVSISPYQPRHFPGRRMGGMIPKEKCISCVQRCDVNSGA